MSGERNEIRTKADARSDDRPSVARNGLPALVLPPYESPYQKGLFFNKRGGIRQWAASVFGDRVASLSGCVLLGPHECPVRDAHGNFKVL